MERMKEKRFRDNTHKKNKRMDVFNQGSLVRGQQLSCAREESVLLLGVGGLLKDNGTMGYRR